MKKQKKKETKATISAKSSQRKDRSSRLEIEALRAELDLPLEGSRKPDVSENDSLDDDSE